jgi:hypothetical protein
VYETYFEQEICDFIDDYISCAMLDNNDPLFDLVQLQIHRHSQTCRKNKEKKCGFGFPKPLLDRTIIFEPLFTPEFI